MKHTNRKSKARTAGTSTMSTRAEQTEKRNRMRRMQLYRNAIIISVLLLAVLGTGIFVFFKLTNKTKIIYAYDAENTAFSLQTGHGSPEYASSLASGLSVVSANVDLEGADTDGIEAGLLFRLSDNEVLFAKSVHQKMYPASITKIVTALVALDQASLDDVVTVSQEAVNLEWDSQKCDLQAGDQITMRQLLYGLLSWSGNDAANAIAEHVGGSNEAFVVMMNEKAAEIGATKTHFVNPHGLHEEDHYTTAYDIYLLFQEAMKYDTFLEVINSETFAPTITRGTGASVFMTWSTTNQYFTGESEVPDGVTVVGGKTGTTDEAGNCLVLLSKDMYGTPYISVILKAATKDLLYNQTSALLNTINE